MARRQRIKGRFTHGQIDWDRLPLGKIPDPDLARQLGCSDTAVAYARRIRGIPIKRKKRGPEPVDPEVRFWGHVDKSNPSGCWFWTDNLRRRATFMPGHFGRRSIYAYRFAFYLKHGRYQKKGMHLDHLCREPRCVNPDHLEEVTGRENTLRGMNPWIVRRREIAATGRCKHGHVGQYTKNGKGQYKCKGCKKMRAVLAKKRKAR